MSRPMIIKGNFKPSREERILRWLLKAMGVLLGLSILASLTMYGVNVHYKSQINDISRATRDLYEENKTLQVHLNRIRSYKNVEAAAKAIPNLKIPNEILDIPAQSTPLSTPPKRHKELPRVYGY